MINADNLWFLALAIIVDAIVGDPRWLWNKLPHPVVLIGQLIDRFDHHMNREHLTPYRRKGAGVIVLVVVLIIIAGVGWGLETLFRAVPFGWIGTVLVLAVMLAGRSLFDHVAAVAVAYDAKGIAAARRTIADIVGRDPESLDEAGIARAAIESTAENFSDGLVAPAFWFAVLGLPGVLVYKAINTADSMIGHRSERYREFGWAAARLDDAVNWIPARFSAALIALAAPIIGGSISKAFKVVASDAKNHRSPNSGWPEAAMAGALNVSLLGPRTYNGAVTPDSFIHEHGQDASIADIRRALKAYVGASMLILLAVIACGFIFV